MKNEQMGSDSTPKRDPLLDELLALDRDGQPDPARLAALEARVQARFQKQNAELDEAIARHKLWEADAELQRAKANPLPLKGWRLAVALAPFVYVLTGLLLEADLGSTFVFAFSVHYWTAAPWILLGGFALWAAAFFRADVRQRLKNQHPAWAKRWLLIFPLIGVLFAGGVFAATPGWAALGGWLAGGARVEREARVVSMEAFKQGAKGCDQSARFQIDDAFVNLCISRMTRPALVEGERVLLVGRASWFGLSIDEIRKR